MSGQDEEVCGLNFDHKVQITGKDPDGTTYWRCVVCDAEGWDSPSCPVCGCEERHIETGLLICECPAPPEVPHA